MKKSLKQQAHLIDNRRFSALRISNAMWATLTLINEVEWRSVQVVVRSESHDLVFGLIKCGRAAMNPGPLPEWQVVSQSVLQWLVLVQGLLVYMCVRTRHSNNSSHLSNPHLFYWHHIHQVKGALVRGTWSVGSDQGVGPVEEKQITQYQLWACHELVPMRMGPIKWERLISSLNFVKVKKYS